jgi:hypothetical protein
MCLDVEYLRKQRHEQQKSNKNMRSWTVELKEELYNMELAFVTRKYQECILREITNILKDRCNDIKRHNIVS